MVKAMKQTENGCRQAISTPNLNKIGQKMGEMHLKAAAAFVLAFDGKGHERNRERMPTGYLHAKFEQNRSKNGRDAFKGHCGLCLAFVGKGHETNWELLLTPLKAAPAFVWPLMVKATKQTENSCPQAICTPNLNEFGQWIPEIPLKAAAAFVWPLMVEGMKQTKNGCQ